MVTAEPVVGEWMEQKLGAQGRLEDAAEGAATIGRLAASFPEMLSELGQATAMVSSMAQSGGIRLDDDTTNAIAAAQARYAASNRRALWVGAIALVVLAVAMTV